MPANSMRALRIIVLAMAISVFSMSGIGCDDAALLTFVNDTSEPINVKFITSSPIFDGERAYYDALAVGQVNEHATSSEAKVNPGESDTSALTVHRRIVIDVIAVDSKTGVVVFKKRFSYRELRQADWTIQVRDMRVRASLQRRDRASIDDPFQSGESQAND